MRRVLWAVGVLMLAAAVRLAITSGVNNNMIFISLLTVGLFGYAFFYNRLINMKWLNVAIGAAALFYVGLAVFAAVYGQFDTTSGREDAVLVLGGGIKGEIPSTTLQKRLNQAYEYHLTNPNALIIVSGGQGPQEDITEALAMERYLVSLGVPSAMIIREDAALSTYENIILSKTILDRYFDRDYTVALITSDFHMFRSIRFARRLGLDCTRCPSGTPWYMLPTLYARESAAIIKYWLIKR